MALQGAAKHALGQLGVLRSFAAGGLSRANALQAGSLDSDDHADSASSTGLELHSRIRNYSTQDLADKLHFNVPTQLRKERPQASSPAMGFAAAGAMLRPRRGAMPILPPRAARPQQLLQARSMNSWTAAQRYFVEGDYVVQAEVNRTFQFTGLDSGSFYPFLVYTTVATAIASVFMIVPWIIAPQRIDLDKASAYECGFDAFGEARQTFSVSFYLVSIMYLLFDIEICYLLPYVLSHASAQMYWTMSMFLALLVVGFVYEWGVGALEWRD